MILVFLIISLEYHIDTDISYTQSENAVPTASTPLRYGNDQSSRLNKGGVRTNV